MISKKVSIKEAKRIFVDSENYDCYELAGYYRLIKAIYGETHQIEDMSISIKTIKGFILKLKDRRRRVITLRFWECYTLQKIADEFCVTRENIRQMQEKILRKLTKLYW